MSRSIIFTAAIALTMALPSHAAPKVDLPCVVYAKSDKPGPWVPSGYMGDTSALHIEDDCHDGPHTGNTCMRIWFTAQDWGGIVWQSPANDWGDQPGGFDLTGAHRLTFWARGVEGGEHVDFKIGLIGPDKKYRDSCSAETKTTLTKIWKQYTIELDGKDLTQIKTGFVFVVSGAPIMFYLDDVKYD